MDRETAHALIFAICILLGQEKDDRTIEEAINEGVRKYQKRLHPEKA